MDGRRRNELHPIGYSGAKHEYRKGVCAGNYAEEILAADVHGRPGFLLDKGGSFAASTTSREAFTADGKTGEALAASARRDDIFLKYCKYGRSQVMGEDRAGFWASTTQLAYGGAVTAPSSAGGHEGGAPSPSRVQDCLWGGDKAHNRRVPVAVHAYSASSERARQLAAEAAASPYRTVEQDTLASAAADAAARAAAKPPMARPRDEQGQDTQVGRKAAGEFAGLFDKDWVRIGLRKP
ncbi:flagellar associated [Chlorella sorokiniana]|uniref:Flagellar associated n=1 Tax=Chlorella sorokiniana TaxID=3076 RepID=A0A2P6U3T3_CHLSO|nr:flagellar associated [Chlorella sorokiniana]|eukprot:PRW60959.1 flagellar associated [Chlorella sorokiniana]